MALKHNAERGVRDRLARFINHLYTEIAVAILIVASVALVLLEAATPPDSPWFETIVVVNDVLTALFIVELSIRYLVAPRKGRFFRRYFIDIVAVVPILRAFRFLRVLRLLRLFRVGVIFSRHLRFFTRTFRSVKVEYVLIVVALVVAVLMGALSMRFGEGGINGDFHHFEDALWFAVMTLIGGEPIGGTPTTRFGRLVTVMLMMGGLTIFAVFTGTVSAVMIDSLRNLKFKYMELDEVRNHIVICGWNPAAHLVIEELAHDAPYESFVIVCERPDLEQDPVFADALKHCFFVVGDYTRIDVLREAGIERASAAILLSDESKEERSFQDRDARTVLAAMLIEKLNEDIYTTVQLHNRDNETSLHRVGVEEIVVSDEYVGTVMASVVRNRGIVSVLSELLTVKRGHQFFKTEVPRELVGETVNVAIGRLKADYDATLIAIDRGGGPSDIVVNPPGDSVLKPAYRIITAASRPPEG